MENPDPAIAAISARAFMDEAETMRALLAHVEPLSALETPIMARAKAWTRQIREHGIGHGVEAFLNAYGLNTGEGVALMCLAEALLRIPDAGTADALIRDTFEGRNWSHYTGSGDSWLVNMSSWGLLLTGKVVDFGQDAQAGMLKTLKHLVAKMGEPVIREALRKAMKLIGGQFVLGETVAEALRHAEPYVKRGYRFSYDILGEGARSDKQAQGYVQSYREGIALIGKTVAKDTPLFSAPGISVKLSALHARYSLTKKERVMNELLPRLKEIISCAKAAGVAVAIDAEEASRLDIELLLFQELLADKSFAGWNGIGFVVQAYQKRAFYLIDWLAGLARTHKRIIPVRLVKGAYWDSEIKWAQLQGLPSYPVFTRKEHTDVSYLACADKILANRDAFYPQFATHNVRTVANIMILAERFGWKKGEFEFQRLHGMGEALHDLIVGDVPSRIYAPVGAHKDLLAYLIRRLLENGANSSFVHLLMDHSKTPEEILADPVAATKKHKELYNPAIPLPPDLYGAARKNSSGMDFGNMAMLEELLQSIKASQENIEAKVREINVLNQQFSITRERIRQIEAKAMKKLGKQSDTLEKSEEDKKLLGQIIADTAQAFPKWAVVDVDKRASILEHAADLLEKNRVELIALCTLEGRKTLPDGVAEVREAADFCRYYAAEARKLFAPQSLTGPAGENNILSLHPRGVFACISPWNFPLAIFMGQVAAALATGNCVIAKPAEQTPLIARRAVELLHEAGIPKKVLRFVTGPGETIGAALVADKRIDGVVFTGGTDTAQRIQQALAARGGPIVPLIAETGGQNCMVVDSSALPEQAVDDIMLSAFGSAGQRCSALRVLFVQEDIADNLLELLAGAMQELKIGDPLDPATDIGPVIDAEAQAALLAHIEKMKTSARLIAAAPYIPPPLGGRLGGGHELEELRHTRPHPNPPPNGEGNFFVAPHAFEIKNIGELTRENFGPVLHVIRFKTGELPQVADAINSTGYALTFGIHSRVDEHIRLLASSVRAGNIYVNRSMIGATVGVQPFGGEGLSGTGPKAGGPHYLMRFVSERTLTINTAAIGGNVTLLAS